MNDTYIIGAPSPRSDFIMGSPTRAWEPDTKPYMIGTAHETQRVPRYLDTMPPVGLGSQFSPTCTVVYGRRNAGKTYFMTLHSMAQRRRLDTYGYGHTSSKYVRIAANYWNHLAYKDGAISQYILDELTKFPPWGKDLCLYVDEIQGQALARRSMSAGAVNLSSFLTMIRKRDIDLMCTTQFPQTLDQQVLFQFDFTCEVASSFDKTMLRLWVTDFWGQYNNEPRRLKMPPMRSEADMIITITVPDPARVFREYNHKQVIAPRYLEESVRDALVQYENENYGSIERLPGFVGMGEVGNNIPDSEFTPEPDITRTTFEERQARLIHGASVDGDPFRMGWAPSFMLNAFMSAWQTPRQEAINTVYNLGGTVERQGNTDIVRRPPRKGGA